MVNCQSSSYEINKTDSGTDSILLLKGKIDQDSLDITLLGKRRREYGEIFNENLLHLLENFASPEDSSNPGNPDTSVTSGNVLENPTVGQFWYNSTVHHLYYYTGTKWKSLSQSGDVAGNYGTILDGEQIPQPVSPVTGYIFPYSECTWVVSPTGYDSSIDFMKCFTDLAANVVFKFRKNGSSTLFSGIANYLIIGIRNDSNAGEQIMPQDP